MECEFSARERSLEEDAKLQHSTKKAFNLSSKEEYMEEPRMDVKGLNSGLLAVKLTPEVRKKIRSKWAHAFIVKVFGRSVGFHFLRNRVMSLWKPAGRLDCVDLGMDYFLMRFGLVEDYNNILNGGPWFIGEYFLSIRRWEPNFKLANASCDSVAVWIRLPKLPFEYYEIEVLKEIGNAIGLVLRIDSNTASEILLEGLIQEIRYEGFRSLCFSCGRIGHRRDGCPHTIKAQTPEAHEEAETMNKENGSKNEGDQGLQEARKVEEEAEPDRSEYRVAQGVVGSSRRFERGAVDTARKSDGAIARIAYANQSQSDHDMGLVRHGQVGGLEAYFPSDTSKSQGGLPSPDRSGVDGAGPPLVDIPIGQTNESRGKDFQLEGSIAAISGAKLEQIKSSGKYKGKENLGSRGRDSKVLGKRGFQDSGPGKPSLFQSAGQLSGATTGDFGAHDGCGERGGITHEKVEGVGMELSDQVAVPDSA
ncbi:uncharacterized protein CFP56_028389 [Quercus suber]|uniref:CCHC-type domain-containing protein n=1 Tax=Quercus suber TaxID=58331 RepID=A0AAW0JT91_QUESU